ncbi:hypothetical protein GCK72_005864 [Caenorhabditis remanei]|uniref:Uncharacterized protein n=1 Tax=Caenorhabditis remanei TaxID=31234 RepID=A0A6A5HFY3_CAERE|nr:hypothetical protein GCK72_005864 [Caenorhabditis remanei]KAF1765911.1 hypothetical protein GCK72_005864 [Caenorhabditis remanei]
MTFNEKKFKQYLKNIEERKDVTHSLKSLIRMDIPNGLIKEVIHETEKYLRNENFWKPAMKLIKKLDLQSKCPDLSVYAKRLKDSKSMKMAWRNARIEKMDEIEWIKEQERKMENKERKRHSIEIEVSLTD